MKWASERKDKRLMKTEGEKEGVGILLLYETSVPSHLAYKRDRSTDLKKNTTELGEVKRRADSD